MKIIKYITFIIIIIITGINSFFIYDIIKELGFIIEHCNNSHGKLEVLIMKVYSIFKPLLTFYGA